MKLLNYFLLGFFLALALCITLFRWDVQILNAEILEQGAYNYLYDSTAGYIIRLIILTGFISSAVCMICSATKDNDNENNNHHLLQTT